MSNMVRIPRIYSDYEALDPIVDNLVEQGTLPYDFNFRLQQLDDTDTGSWGSSKPSTRQATAVQDVMAALDLGPESEHAPFYLHGDLPVCVSLVRGVTGRSIVRQLDTHYLLEADMTEAAQHVEKPTYLGRQAWKRLLSIIDTGFYGRLLDSLDDWPKSDAAAKRQVRWAVGHVAIRSDAVFDLYNDDHTARLLGRSRRQLVHHALLDNYPELGSY